MSRHVAAVIVLAVALALGILSGVVAWGQEVRVVVPGGPGDVVVVGGEGNSAGSTAAAGGSGMQLAKPLVIPDDPATKAQVDELMKKIEDLQKTAPNGFWGRWLAHDGTEPVDLAKQAEAVKQINEAKTEILRLTDGAEVAAKYGEFVQKLSDLQRQQVELGQDKDLDTKTKAERYAGIGKQMSAVYTEYREAAGRSMAIETALYQHSSHRRDVEALKSLLKSTDEEWKALEPKVSAVLRLLKDLRAAQGPTAPTFTMVPSYRWQQPPVGTPDGDLITVLKGGNPDAAAVKPKLDALRRARTDEETKKTAKVADLTKQLKVAQDKLRELLTVSQEAKLVIEGLLD